MPSCAIWRTSMPCPWRDAGAESRRIILHFCASDWETAAWVNGQLLKGLLGWLAWGMVHVMFLVGYRNRITVMLEWVWSYFVYDRGARLITGSPEAKVKKVRGIKMQG